MKEIDAKKLLLILSAFASTAIMLSFIQPPFDISPLAWVALVPFILICQPQFKNKFSLLIAYAVSLLYWLINLYWMGHVTWSGWAAFCIYTALLWPILVIALRWCFIKKIPLTLAVPVLFVGAERLQGLFLDGFFWRFLAHSQYKNITLIQIADIFGTAGVSFIIAMVNALAVDLVISAKQKRLLKIDNFFKTAVVISLLLATFLYGRFRIEQTNELTQTGPLVAAVQPNIPQSVKESGQASEKTFADLLADSNDAANAGAELIVWPETMAEAILTKSVWPYLANSINHQSFDDQLAKHAKDTAYILVGAPGAGIEYDDNMSMNFKKYNSAFLYTPHGLQSEKQYNKIHLVPFGEVVPFKKSIPVIHKLLMKFTPYDYDYNLDYGTDYTIFEMTAQNNKEYKFGVMICYEDAIPYIARNFALDPDGRKKLDWLLNISNDGWFVKFKDNKITPRTELPQRTAICAFRAIENRLPILRSVNAGISCLIDSTGRIKDAFLAGTLPEKAIERQAVSGWFADRITLDSRETIFSKYGQWLDFACAFALLAIIMVKIYASVAKKRKGK